MIWNKKLFFILFIFLIYPSSSFPNSQYIVAKEGIHVRMDSTVTSSSLGFLNKDDEVEVLEEKYEWFRIKLPKNFKCYISRQYIKKIANNKGEVSPTTLNLRHKPSLESHIIGKVHCGDIVNIIRGNKEWYTIIAYPYATGWVHQKFLKKYQGKMNLASFIHKTIPELSTSDIRKKENIHLQLIKEGEKVVPLLETYLASSDKNTCYSIIFILSEVGKRNSQLVPHFFKKADNPSIKVTSVYLDIIQNIVQPKTPRIAYFYLAEEGKLLPKDVHTAIFLLREKYNKNEDSKKKQ